MAGKASAAGNISRDYETCALAMKAIRWSAGIIFSSFFRHLPLTSNARPIKPYLYLVASSRY